MEIVKELLTPVTADSVLSPQIYYGDSVTSINFITQDDKYGRITFEKLDSIKVSRGEYFPYEYDWKNADMYSWVKIIEDSNWLRERYEYENKYYGRAYEFNGDVNEMLTDFKHYVFCFHDEFIEVIASGIWFEEDSENLFGRGFLEGHPFLPISEENMIKFEAHGLVCQARINNKTEEKLKQDSIYCSQKLIEFALEIEKPTIEHTLTLVCKDSKYISRLRGYFGKKEVEFDGIAALEDVKPYIESYMKEVADRRKAMGY